MKKTIFLLLAIIAFLLPIGLTSCDTGDWEPLDPPKEMKLSVIKNDEVLRTFYNDGSYPKEKLLATFNPHTLDGYYYEFKYGNRFEYDSINEPDTPIYNIILNKKYVGDDNVGYFNGRYNFTLKIYQKGTYFKVVDGKATAFIYYRNDGVFYIKNKTLLEFLSDIKGREFFKYKEDIYRIDIFIQNK